MADYQKMHLSVLLKHYKRADIQAAILNAADRKEIAVSYGGTGYGKRPDTISYPKDVLEMVKQGGTSFHCSEELWKSPEQIVTGMKPEEYNQLRTGWDLILDIDCKELDYSKIAADLLVQALQHYGIKCISVKFSGNHGFHIGVPFETFPEFVNYNGKETPVKNLFPEGPRKIASYLQGMISDVLAKRLLELDSPTLIAQKSGKTVEEIIKGGRLDPFAVLAIDTVLIASRHLYRMPYSLNEKSGLVSVVIHPEDILKFDRSMAVPEKVVPTITFLERKKAIPHEAKNLFVQAFDAKVVTTVQVEHNRLTGERKDFEPIASAIPEQFFPPCIQKIAGGLVDGKKRALLILINFLGSCGWDASAIEKYVTEWNKKNTDPLRDNYVQGQLRYIKTQKKLPPNCDNPAYMKGILVCDPDGFCPKIKNPANYAIQRQRLAAWMAERDANKGKRKKKVEELPKEKSSEEVKTHAEKKQV
ncbi:MAG TPA: hypothetical protein VJJ82_02665 [Candidatus Nanoarchaeia archaeon]|nr:hypothetical protein [Candidatus Nanoarchaeia archaeon]